MVALSPTRWGIPVASRRASGVKLVPNHSCGSFYFLKNGSLSLAILYSPVDYIQSKNVSPPYEFNVVQKANKYAVTSFSFFKTHPYSHSNGHTWVPVMEWEGIGGLSYFTNEAMKCQWGYKKRKKKKEQTEWQVNWQDLWTSGPGHDVEDRPMGRYAW